MAKAKCATFSFLTYLSLSLFVLYCLSIFWHSGQNSIMMVQIGCIIIMLLYIMPFSPSTGFLSAIWVKTCMFWNDLSWYYIMPPTEMVYELRKCLEINDIVLPIYISRKRLIGNFCHITWYCKLWTSGPLLLVWN